MKIGDKVRKTINTSSCKDWGRPNEEETKARNGRVIYIDPKGRFYTAEFHVYNRAVRESFFFEG